MKNPLRKYMIAVPAILFAGMVNAQSLATVLFPTNPTSADNLKLSISDRTCGGGNPYTSNTYLVSMSQNNITVRLGEHVKNPVPLCPASPREEIDLGRLPAGSYTLTVIEGPTGTTPGPLIENAPFTIADARARKAAPFVRLDYSGHWWDPNDSGWGLFIWHDARDNILAAWFTYTPDGKPVWYVFQPTWETHSITTTTSLQQTFRAPGPTSPPPAPTNYVTVGSAKLDFTNFGTGDVGKIIYTFNGGTQLTRNIQRFKQ